MPRSAPSYTVSVQVPNINEYIHQIGHNMITLWFEMEGHPKLLCFNYNRLDLQPTLITTTSVKLPQGEAKSVPEQRLESLKLPGYRATFAQLHF